MWPVLGRQVGTAAGRQHGRLCAERVVVVGTTDALGCPGQRRWRTSAKSRFTALRQRALLQHVDYLRQLTPPKPYRQVEVDKKLRRPGEELRTVFNHPEITQQPQPELQLRSLDRIAAGPAFVGQLGQVDFGPFGTIEVVHGDIFAAQADAVILPMAPSLVPYRGLPLEAFNRGGPHLVRETYRVAKDTAGASGLQAGDFLPLYLGAVPERNDSGGADGGESRPTKYVAFGDSFASKYVAFSIMPWFWQGSPLDAAKRFQHCVRRALQGAVRACRSLERERARDETLVDGFASVALPHIGGGIFGYEPRSSSRVLLHEAVEVLLQVEAEIPNYRLNRIIFTDSRRETAEELHEALVEVSHAWLPERRLTTAAQYWGLATRRLIVLPAAPNFFWKRHSVKFKKYHGVKRKARRNYIGNVRPNLWRPQRVHQPPPMLVYRESGEAAPGDRQLRPRPYYFRGVTHWLFPSNRSGFHGLRRNSRGQWVAHLQRVRYAEATKPRL